MPPDRAAAFEPGGGGLKGLPDSVATVWPAAVAQRCVIHLMRANFRYAARGGVGRPLSGDQPPVAGRVDPVRAVPGLRVEIRRVICSTNAIESLNARFRQVVRARGHFPNEQAAMKTLHLVVRSLDPKDTGQTRWVTRWKPALNASADRMPAAENH